ncbi:hypothetical protein LTR56_021998 [Elasticomyces elasticus]|nr:hypothetical protein LTR56_021998 [Elasticomyces elasticus]KAK3630213.1 hypothetical protein LTR22_021591 [Elasticomyces elasticus]KAK4920160.1 hypothetical protein LTR49_012259 [Elasticomyces elasticus]KAK5748944.1 hypothetical protein LTS12_020981 [Elasticomyces elasticus]
MVALSELRSANAALNKTHSTSTGVFIGATRGIGLATLRAFAEYIPNPTAIIIGRSRTSFASKLESLRQINPNGTYTFIDSEITLIKDIDAVCETIKRKLNDSKIDLLITSQGYISFAGRETNADGLDNSISLRYYGRVRFTQNLLPVMATHGRVVSILAGGQEGKILEDDLDLERNYSIPQSAAQFASMMTLSFDQLAAQNPEKAYIHAFPGLTSTGLLGRSATGVLGVVFRWVLEPLLGLFSAKAEDVGQRMLYYGTVAEFAEGSWALDEKGASKEVEVLKGYRETGWAEKVAEHNGRMFERALAR